ncbi:MAG TPA: hypothetical protein VFC73_08010 [Syntrophomonadaceae bacterium]|nr:hypothetical protein [Syntrophomonadaceae bacterium]
MFEDCIKCGLCKENCFIEKAGFESLTSFVSGDSNNKDLAWVCANCWYCQEHCLQEVNIMEGKLTLQRLLKSPEAINVGIANVKQCGFCLPIDEDVLESRVDQGLDKFNLLDETTIAYLLG